MPVFMFPGQGSQFVGMGKPLYEKYDFIREIFEIADRELDLPLTELIFNGPAEELQKTANAQPAILTVSVAMYELLKRRGFRPAAVAGHSLGEYSALVAAGALEFGDAVRLVRLRGQYMQEAVPLGRGGMMAVLGLAADQVLEGCRRAAGAGIVEAANFNCPGQVVVAGENRALERAQVIFKEMGAKRCIPLQVSAPFHCSMMEPAGAKLARELAGVEIRDPRVPVVANVNAEYASTAGEVREALVRQVSSPVLWEQSVRRLLAGGHDVFVEVGPGQVLTGLVKKISRDARTAAFGDAVEPEKIIALLKEAV
jgi:[acyl-carrier-protein] S-malonyltransferase